MGNCFGNKPNKSNGKAGGGGAYSSGSLSDLGEYAADKRARRAQARSNAEILNTNRQIDLAQIQLDPTKGSAAQPGGQNRYVDGNSMGQSAVGGRGSRANSNSNSRVNGVTYGGHDNIEEPQSSCKREFLLLVLSIENFSIKFDFYQFKNQFN